MASRAEYLQMMKNMEKDSMGEERINPSLNMGLDSLMPNMGKGSVSNREMNPTGNDMEPMMPDITDPKLKNLNTPPISQKGFMDMINRAKGILSDKELEMLSSGAGMSANNANVGTMASMEKALKDRVANASMASMGGVMSDKELNMLENAMGGSVTDEIREAVGALMSMGISMTDAIEALGDEMTMPETMTEGAMSDKEMGALSRLPQDMGDEGSVSDYERSLGKDRTYSDDMYKQINT
tara:strand:+ start:187 stop:906 length:720 start_codon:yes stop_codon:yes gene_type:complete